MSSTEYFNSIPWEILSRCFGNFHSTLIGMVAQWWLQKRTSNIVLDAPFGIKVDDKNVKYSDLLLYDKSDLKFIVEVEGTHPIDKIRTIRLYQKIYHDCPGILLIYDQRYQNNIWDEEKIKKIWNEISSTNKGNSKICLLVVKKEPYPKIKTLLPKEKRKNNEYIGYKSTIVKIGKMESKEPEFTDLII